MDRFWSLVNCESECWTWKRRTKGPYPAFRYEGRTVRANRMAWFIVHGKWPELDVLHRCDNTQCVRPSHLFEGDDRANSMDCAVKGRKHRKVSNEQVLDIRNKYLSGVTMERLASQYRLNISSIHEIVRGYCYSYIDGAVPASRDNNRKGSAHDQSKLTEQIVKEARHLYATNRRLNVSELARKHGISQANMRRAVLGLSWKHV